MKKPKLSFIIIGINVAVYLALMAMAGLNAGVYGDLLLRYGAKINGNIVAGEYWRLLSPIVFHGGIAHLLLNCFSLYAFGRIAESIYGAKRFLVIYLTAGLTGSLFSLCFSPYPSVGASGSIFGLFGAMLYIGVRNPDFMKTSFGKDILGLAALNLIYGFTASGIDNFGHLGGLVGGFLVTGILSPRVERLRFNSRVLSALGLAAVVALGSGYGLTKPLNVHQSYISTLMELESRQEWDAMQVYGIGRLRVLPADSAVRSDILFYVVRSAAVQGDYAVAEKYSRELAALDPAFGNYFLSLVLFDQGKFDEAAQTLDQAEDSGFDPARAAVLRERLEAER